MSKTIFKKYLRKFENPRFGSFAVIISFVIAGTILLIATKASTPNGSFEAENGSRLGGVQQQTNANASGGGYVKFGPSLGTTVRRFYADNASWNLPASHFGAATDPKLTMYRDRFWEYAGISAPPGATNVDFKDYSVPMYDISEGNKDVRLFQVLWAQNQQSFSTTGLNIGSTIKWNDNWKPGTGNDRIMHVVDLASGTTFGFWVVGEPKNNCVDANPLGITAFDGPNTKAGYDPGNPNHLCMAAANFTSGLYSITDGTTHNERGMGIDKLALVTRADEVKSGAIRHAIELTITSTMFGAPECSPNKGYSAPGAGTSCGFYLAPATRVEFATNENNRIGQRCEGRPITVDNAARSLTVPEGIRLALNISDNDIEAWLNSRGYTGAKRNTARIFAVALRDYGGIVAETGCNGIGIETDGLMNPTSARTWAELGITDIPGDNNPHGDLLQGLLTKERLYVVNPPN